MEHKIQTKNRLPRKKFFTSLSIGLLGVTIFNSFPFNIFKNKIDNKTAAGIKVIPNPYAVDRKKIGGKNA